MSDITVLITGGGGSASEAVYRLLNHRYRLHFADADICSIPASIPVDSRHPVPFASEPEFIDSLSGICTDNNVDMLVPAVDEELVKLKEIVKKNPTIKLMAPDFEYVETMLDKLNSMNFLEDKGIPVPRTVPLAEAKSVGFPCIAKPRWGRGSRGVFTLNKPEDVDAYIQLTGYDADNAVAQEKLYGEEYTVSVVADSHEELHCVVPIHVDVKRGITIRASVIENRSVINACERIHNAAPAKATYNVQLMQTNDGRVLPFEINPRISTTFCLVLASGIDPFSVFMEGRNRALPYRGNKLQRYWINEFSDFSKSV